MDKKNSITVALIEDDQMLSEMYSIKFSKEGFRIVTAMNGADGLALIEKENPQIVLLDIIMPKMDGFQVLKELREKGVKTPVIMLTNLGQEEDIQKGKQLGATDYFVKSNFTPEAIVHKVRHVLGQS